MSGSPQKVADLLPALMRYTRRLTREESEAEDLVHSAKHPIPQILRVTLPRSPTHRRFLQDGSL